MSHHVFLPPESFVGWMLEDVLDPARCSEIVADLVRRGFSATAREYPDDYRNNDRLVVDHPELAEWLFARTRERLPQELIIDGERWVLDSLNPRFRACRYAGGQSFCIHRDGPYAPSADLRSHLTLQLYLDDDPSRAGGRTRFYADPRGETAWAAVDPRVGAAIVFDHRAWHDGEPVTRGIKHVLRTDVLYRRVAARDVEDAAVLYRHRGYAWHVIACRDGSIASAGRDGTIRRWHRDRSASAPAVDATLDLGAGSVTRLAEASDGRIWAGTRGGKLFVIEGLVANLVTQGLGAILGLAARPDGGMIASTSHGTLVAFERNGARAWETHAHEGWAWSVVSCPDGYLTSGHDGVICSVDERGSIRRIVTLDAPVRVVAIAGVHGGDRLAAGDTLGRIHRLSRDGELLSSGSAHQGAVTSIAFAGDQLVSGGEDGRVCAWSGERALAAFEAPDFITSIAVTRRELLWSSYDGAIRHRGL